MGGTLSFQLLSSDLNSSPDSQALPYVALLIAMIFFIYAVIGMQVRYRTGGQAGAANKKTGWFWYH